MKPRFKLFLDGARVQLAPPPAQVRAEFDRRGLSLAGWARERGFGRSLVYEVVSGRKKCKRGQSHKIAVLLGMKHGEIVR